MPGSAKLVAKPTGEPEFELLPISETTFIRRDENIKYEFVRSAASDSPNRGAGNIGGGSAGPAESLQIRSDDGTVWANRVSPGRLVPFELLLAGKTSEAIEGYRKIKKEKSADASVSENRLNNLGYVLLRQKKLAEAIALFKLNVEFYPNAWNVYDSLGEAYMINCDNDLAITNYKKSLELNPADSNGVEMLKKLEAK